MPSYATDVQPITCHSPSGEEPSRPLQTYGEVFALRGSILGQVNNCIMPLGSATQPTDAQRVALLTWLVCGAPNN